jgi:hypothetical protein
VGHEFETSNPQLVKNSKKFVTDKATGPQEKLRVLTGNNGYRDDEVAYPDHFLSPYVGKVYPDATEVMSMGFEPFTFRSDLNNFYKEHPDHLEYMVGTMLVNQASSSKVTTPKVTTPKVTPPKVTTPTLPINTKGLSATRKEMQKYASESLILEAEKNIQKMIDDSDIMIRIPSVNVLEKIINAGRFKSQFETQTSKGLKNQSLRKKVEKELFGYSEDLPPEQRPIYGYIGNSEGDKQNKNGGKLDNYGKISVKLKQDIKDFATVTGDDSLNVIVDEKGTGIEDGRAYYPSPVNKISISSFKSVKNMAEQIEDFDDDAVKEQLEYVANATNVFEIRESFGKYLEVQLHRPVTVNDISEIVFYDNNKPSELILNWAKKNNVTIKQEKKQRNVYN